MTSSTKQEVHNVRTVVRGGPNTLNVIHKFVKFGYVVFEICPWTDKQPCEHVDRTALYRDNRAAGEVIRSSACIRELII